LRDTDGFISDWQVDTDTKRFNYICQH